jgi:hypothetical protein
MNNQAKRKLEKIKKMQLPEKVRATADKIEKGLSSADAATQKKAEDALNKLYDQIKAVAAKQREEKTQKEVNEKTIVPQNSDIAAPAAKKELTKKTTVADDVIDKALKNDPELAGFGRSDKRRDAGRKALPAGRRVARKGWANQFGKSDGGRVYYENRENRKDRKSPSYKSGYPYLAKGGKIHPMDDEDGTFYVNLYKTKGDQMMSVDEREYSSKASAMTYAMMKRDFMKEGESIFVMNDDGDVLYTSIGTKKMAMGGKFPYQNAQVGDSARVILDNKMGTIMVTYGRRFHLKFPDGTEKTYSAEELEFYPDDNMMAKGGEIVNQYEGRTPEDIWNNLTKTQRLNFLFDHKNEIEMYRGKELRLTEIVDANDSDWDGLDEMLKYRFESHTERGQYAVGGMMAKGGYMAEGENYEYVNTFKRFDSNVPVPDEDFEKLVDAYHKQLSGDKLAVSKYKVLKLQMGNYLGHKTVEEMEAYIEKTHNAHKMADGGYMADGGAIKGSNPSTGEKFGVVIGSLKKEDGLTILIIRSSYSARIKSYELTFDEKGFLRSIGDFGHTIDGTYPDMKGGHLSVKNVDADNKKESIDALTKITSPSFAKKVYDYVQEEKMAKGGYVDIEAKLIKELQKLQRDLNSDRLNTYREGDNSDEEKARQRERESKLVRFNEILELLRENDAKKMAKGGMMDNGVDYVELINLIKSADNPRNLPIYYNSDSNVVNIGGVGYDKGELVKMFNARAGQSLEIKNLFYQANQYPQETKNRIESMNVGIEVEIGKGYGNETFVKYIKMAKGGYMADGGVIGKGKNGYVAFYKGKRVEVYADTMYGAQKTAAQYFKAKREFDVNVVLAEVDGKPYIQSTAFAAGGYVSKRDIEAITIVNPNKSNPKKNYLTFRSGEFLNGLNQFAKGGKLTDNYTYIKRSDIFAVYYKDKAKKYNSIMESKPKNGFWVSKKALIREGGKTPSAANAPFDAYESYDEFDKLNYKVWDKLKIESGSEIYASDSLQKKLALEYPNSGIDAKFKSLKAIQRKKVAEIMTDENKHSLRNYLTLRGYLGQKEYDIDERIFDPKNRYVLNPANFKKEMASGGKIGFEALSKKVASRYAGKNVKPKYQGEYGKTYDKAEAKEVGDKVAAKVYRMQQGKMAMGGKIELPYELDKYFTKPAGTIEVEMTKLIPIRARKEGIENAEVYMKKAYDGKMSKRKPIEIYKTRNKKYRVNDGNSTYAVAKKNGWETIYATVVSNPNVSKRAEKSTFAIAKEIRKEGEKWSDAVKRVKENRK